ncbi:C40 family peptidase [Paenibacillus polymyxa]|uniref:C40 family peptidase n=1 Tax=Paenibacillus TaxID=44249 RepID=UPI00042E2718|nr:MULTISPECIES: SH3 domain-containing protein [Paenibacillus]AHM67905.1 nlp/p60 family protein [Paenibacillus polymyxa SQR-21]AIY08617.1 hydrolase [Paenibacillus polymyxa]AUS28532.1 nlp/p60 family protein [Paenibacillus polymyxa]KAF6654572.1 SH3 domain-containing protein [Paenibacillus sp. EKM301P]KJK29253.1 hydrolase [Paenibacillus polymyxa]
MRRRVMGMLMTSAALLAAIHVAPGQVDAAASTASTGQKAVIQAAVKLRSDPSTTGDVVSFMKQGEAVTVLEKTNSYWYKIKTSDGVTGYTSSSDKYIKVGATSVAAAVTPSASRKTEASESAKTVSASVKNVSTKEAPASVNSSAGQTKATIQTSVRLRAEASTSSEVLGYMNTGDVVTITDSSNAYWFKITTADGTVGYVSSSPQYIRIGEGVVVQQPVASSAAPASDTTALPAVASPASTVSLPSGDAAAAIEQVIDTGMTYLGTPYEYGSDRNSTATFDCSAFTRQIFRQAVGIQLPADSRSQGEWIKQNSQPNTDMTTLKRGDLLFFTNYNASSGAYTSLDNSSQTITHVAVYLGDNKLLHTFSVAAGGVKVTDFSKPWQDRFLFGGSVIQ